MYKLLIGLVIVGVISPGIYGINRYDIGNFAKNVTRKTLRTAWFGTKASIGYLGFSRICQLGREEVIYKAKVKGEDGELFWNIVFWGIVTTCSVSSCYKDMKKLMKYLDTPVFKNFNPIGPSMIVDKSTYIEGGFYQQQREGSISILNEYY